MTATAGQQRERLYGCRDDLQLILSLSDTRDHTPTNVRQAAVHFRRLLIDGDLSFAATTVGLKVRLVVPPSMPSSEILASRAITYYQQSPARLGDIEVGFISNGASASWPGLDPDPYQIDTAVSLDAFLNQRVAEFHGSAARRRDFIQYSANIMGGAHYGKRMPSHLEVVDRLRRAVGIEVIGGNLAIKIEAPAILNRPSDVHFVDQHYNPVHIELLATARLIARSPFIGDLLAKIALVA